MKKIYIIIEAQSSNWDGFNMSQVVFVFTSKKAAMRQMDNIGKCVEAGQWWRAGDDCPWKGKVISDEVVTNCHVYDFMRDLHIKSPYGKDIIYRMIGYDNVNSTFEYIQW